MECWFLSLVVCRLTGVATKLIPIIRVSRRLYQFHSVPGGAELLEESSEISKWFVFCCLTLFYNMSKCSSAICGFLSKLRANYNLFKYIQAARETGALKAAKDKLEKRVEELTWRLQLEKRLRVAQLYSYFQIFHLFKSNMISWTD